MAPVQHSAGAGNNRTIILDIVHTQAILKLASDGKLVESYSSRWNPSNLLTRFERREKPDLFLYIYTEH